MSPINSRTWSAHIRHLSDMYQMEDPLSCLRRDPPLKSTYKEYVMTKISSFHERELRDMAYENSCMTYFNVSLLGLRGRLHPAIKNIHNTNQVINMRPHLKMLTGDYLTYEKKSHQSGGSPVCRICQLNENDSYMHILLFCESLSEPRERILTEIITFCQVNNVCIEPYLTDPEKLTQFLLDPASMNLPVRVNINDPILDHLFKLSRDLCFALHKLRMKLIHEKT